MGVFSVIGKCHGIPPLGVDERSRNPLLVFIVFTVVCDPNTQICFFHALDTKTT